MLGKSCSRTLIGLCVTVFALVLLHSCVLFPFKSEASYDSKTINIQSINLFNQRDLSSASKGNWRGDWLFRRLRLSVIDQELRSSKPDILVFQEGMERLGSPSESDEAILSAGALQGYDWQKTEIRTYDDTQESESMGVAVGLPLKLTELVGTRNSWVLGNDGYMTVSVVNLENQPIVIFNVQMPPKIGRKYLWYTFIQERVSDFVRTGKFCPKRVIIAGYMPTEQGAQRFQSFKDALRLKDTGDEFCNVASECYTASPENELYLAVSESILSGQVDKVLVHQNALVFSGSRNLSNPHENLDYINRYSLRKLWPGKRYGWTASIRLPRCNQSEISSLSE